MAGAQPRIACGSVLQQFEIPSVSLQYMNFVINNQEIFQTKSSIRNINTRNKHHFQKPNVNISFFQKSIFYACKKFFNILTPSLTILKNDKVKFKAVLRQSLNTQSSYSLEELILCEATI